MTPGSTGLTIPRVFVGLPAYNEERVLPELLEELHRSLEALGRAHTLVVVNDGSTDGTAGVLDRAGQRLPVDAVHHSRNQNLGGAMRSLFRRTLELGSAEDVLVCMDADNTFRPDQIGELLVRIEAGANLVVASRYVEGGGTVGVPWHRNLMSLGANRLFRLLFPIEGVSEYTCSFRAYRLSLLQEAVQRFGEPWIRDDGFTSMPEILIRLSRLPLSTAQVPVRIRYDLKVGASKMKVARNVLATLSLMRRLRAEFRRPGQPVGEADGPSGAPAS